MLLPWPEFLCPGQAVLGVFTHLAQETGRLGGREGGGGSAEEAAAGAGAGSPSYWAPCRRRRREKVRWLVEVPSLDTRERETTLLRLTPQIDAAVDVLPGAMRKRVPK